MPQEEATTSRPFSWPFIRLLRGAATTVSLLPVLLMGPMQEAAQPQSGAPQVYCGPWEVEPWYSAWYPSWREGSSPRPEPEWEYWNYRWCYSPEVSGGWYKDFAGYSLTAPDTTLTNTPSVDSVAVGEPATFHLTQTNNEPYTLLSPVVTFLRFPVFPATYEVASATSSQGQCSFITHGGVIVGCELGALPPGTSAYMDIIVVPQEPGTLPAVASSNLGVIGQAATPLSPNTEANVTVEPA